MSDSMISGFTSGTAWIVIASQIKHVFGLSLPRHHGPLKVILVSMYKLYYVVLEDTTIDEQNRGLGAVKTKESHLL